MPKPKTKADPIAGFEGLNDDDRAWLKDYQDKDWRVSFDSDGWHAYKDGVTDDEGDEVFGAYESFVAMMNAIEREEKAAVGIEFVDQDAAGRKYLPGMERETVPFLDNMAYSLAKDIADWKMLGKKIKDKKADVLNTFNDERFQVHFTLEEETGNHVYLAAEGGGLLIKHKAEDKVESFADEHED